MPRSKKPPHEIFAEIWPIERAMKRAVEDALLEHRVWREVKARAAAERRSKSKKSRNVRTAKKRAR